MGRYINPETGKPVNVHRGLWMERGVDILYFIRNGKRVYISDFEFSNWVKVENA